jgi:hypothetical protein
VSKDFVPPVEPSGVGAQKPFHARHQICPGCFHHQMKVIGHQTKGMDLPAGFAAGFPQRLDEPLPILLIPEYRFAPVAPVHYVINRTGIFHSELAGHRPDVADTGNTCQYQELTRLRAGLWY